MPSRFQLTPITKDYKTILKGDPCAFCGERAITIDHIFPLVNRNESQSDPVGFSKRNWQNMAPACSACNLEKGSYSLIWFMWRRSRGDH